jgi:hypothetical protein
VLEIYEVGTSATVSVYETTVDTKVPNVELQYV